MTHPFFAKAYKKSLVIPNKIVVQSREDDSPQYSGEATDAESYALLPRTEYYQTYLESNAQATKISEAKLSKAQLWSDAGALNVPMNVAQETYDYIKATDQREGDTRTGNIGTLTQRYVATKNKWTTGLTFGNWQTVRRALADLGITPDDLEAYFSRLQVGDLYAEHILADNIDLVWIDPDGTIDLSKIGDNLDNLPNGEVYARVKTLHLDAGLIKLDENILYSSGYNPTTKFDLGSNDFDDIPEGTVYQRTKSAALSAAGLILLDQVIAGTYGLVYSADISAHHIKLSKCSGDLDDIDNGSTYAKLKTTSIDAGSILLNSYTKISGEWYDEAGVEIDAAHGINIYGQNNALTTRATKTGTIQCYVGSDGAIYAGGGNVKLDSNGIKIYGEDLRFYYGTTYSGYVMAVIDGIEISGEPATTKRLRLGGSEIIIDGAKGVFLYADSGYGIYASGAEFMNLPRKTSPPSSPSDGMLVFNPTTHQTNVYRSGIGWQHYNYDAGWA